MENLKILSINNDSKGLTREEKLKNEYVAIHNVGELRVNIKGWSIRDYRDNQSKFHEFIFEEDITLYSNDIIVLCTGEGEYSKHLSKDKNIIHVIYQNSKGFIWNNDIDRAELYSPTDKINPTHTKSTN